MENVTHETLRDAYDKAAEVHKNHLKADGVKLPRFGTCKGYWLATLFHYKPNKVHKDTISKIVNQHMKNVAADQQVRHLKRDGWNMESFDGYHWIEDPYTAHPSFAREQIRSQNYLLATDWEGVKSASGYKCVTCGAKEGEPDPRYPGGGTVALQKGHKDPEKALDLRNTIPQCQFCNRAYKDDFTFDDKGRVRAVASPKPVLRASKSVRRDVMRALKEKDG